MGFEVKMGEPIEVQLNDNKNLGEEVQVIADANVLKPNRLHKNFTATDEIIPIGTILFGRAVMVDGLRRGLPFKYRLFSTNDKKIIHLNKIKPMRTTEVTLGADAAQTPTLVDMARPKLNLTKWTIGGALAGAGAAYYYSAKMKNMERNKVILFSLVGLVAGFYVGKAIEKRRPVKITPSK
jgi:hypothetical protein